VQEDKLGSVLAITFLVLLVALFVGEQTLAILSVGILSGSKVLSDHPDCGFWVLNTSWIGPLQNIFGSSKSLFRDRPWRATTHAEKCYHQERGIENCNQFFKRHISYTEKHNATCPFQGDVCLYGPSSAYSLDTNFTEAAVLGINIERPYYFRRKTTCSPLVMDDRRIRFFNDTHISFVAVTRERSERLHK